MSDPVGDLKRELLAAARRQQGRLVVSAGHGRLRGGLVHTRLLTLATLGVGAAALLLVTMPWRASPGFLERAQAALTPSAVTVLHYKSEATLTSTDPACTVTRPIELWIDQMPPHRYRALTNIEPSPTSAQGDLRSLVCSRGTPAELGGTLEPQGETLMFVPPDMLKSSPMTVRLGPPPDPVAMIRAAISAGTAHDEGKTQLDGRTVERIRLDPSAFTADDPSCPSEPVYAYVDPETFYPLQIDGPGVIDPVGSCPVVSFRFVERFVIFEYLPRTAANLALADIRTQHPNAKGP
jgi:hypothetical protein